LGPRLFLLPTGLVDLKLQTCFANPVERWLGGSAFTRGNEARVRSPLRLTGENEAGRNSCNGQKADT